MDAKEEYPFYLGEPMDAFFDGKKFRESGTPINGETLSYRFYNVLPASGKRGTHIVSIPDGTMNYVALSSGDYKVTVTPIAAILNALQENVYYFLRLFGGSSGTATDRLILIKAQYRGSQ